MIGTDTGTLERVLAERQLRARDEAKAGVRLQDVLEQLILTAEIASGGGMIASILLVDETGRHLLHGAAPNLPGAYCAAIDGIAVGQGVGSCGTAAFLGHPVYVTDIERDALWADFRDLALRHSLRACWSTPILDGDRVIGTFAVYHHTPRSPTTAELNAIAVISDAVRVAILDHREHGLG
ncbi:MAG: GAF domain-containing protein [Caulobacter sp.]|nr:GAF domain-containing protein [Caulobacter sp.]